MLAMLCFQVCILFLGLSVAEGTWVAAVGNASRISEIERAFQIAASTIPHAASGIFHSLQLKTFVLSPSSIEDVVQQLVAEVDDQCLLAILETSEDIIPAIFDARKV